MADHNSVYGLREDCAAEKIGDYGRQGTPTTLLHGWVEDAMDRAGIEQSVLSLSGPGVQAERDPPAA